MTEKKKNKSNHNQIATQKIALRGLLVAVAMVLSWVEAQIPAFFAVPGIKLGLTNLVVLAAAIEPDKSARPLATMLTASIDTNNFLTEAHAKLRPVESPTAGVFLSGVCQGPKDIPETVAQAGAAAVKAIGLLAKDKLMTNPCTAKSDELLCNGCSQCEQYCAFGAISTEE